MDMTPDNGSSVDDVLAQQRAFVDESSDPTLVRQAQRNVLGLQRDPSSTPASYDQSQVDELLKTYPTTDSQVDTLLNTLSSPLVGSKGKQSALGAALDSPEAQEALAGSVHGILSNTRNATQAIIDANNQEKNALGEKQTIALKKGQVDANIVREANIREQSIASDRAGFISRNGMDTADYNSAVNLRAIEQQQLEKQMAPLRKQISDMQSVDMMTDPINWFVNQMTIGEPIAQFNALAARYNTNDEFISSGARRVLEVQNANAGKTAAISASQADLLAQQKLLEAQTNATDIKVQAAKLNGATAKEVQEIQAKGLKDLTSLAESNARIDATQNYREENLELAKERRGEQKTKATRLEQEAADKTEADKKAANVMAMAGMPNITTMKQYNALPKHIRDRTAVMMASNGEQLGETPEQVSDMWKFIKNNAAADSSVNKVVQGQFPSEQQVQLLNFVSKDFDETYGKLRTSTIGGKREADAIDTANVMTTDKLKTLMKSPETATTDFNHAPWNPYKSSDLVARANSPEFVSNPLSLKIKEVAAAAPNAPMNSALALQSLALDRTINPSDAARAVASFYQGVVRDNNKSMNFGKAAMPAQDSYNVRINGKMYDLANSKQATDAIMSARMFDSNEIALQAGKDWATLAE